MLSERQLNNACDFPNLETLIFRNSRIDKIFYLKSIVVKTNNLVFFHLIFLCI